MSTRVLLLLCIALNLSSGLAAVAAGAGEMRQRHGIIVGYQFTVCSACAPKLIAGAATRSGKALGRNAVLDGTVHGGRLISRTCKAGDGVARPARNNRWKGGVPDAAERAAEAELSPAYDRHGNGIVLARIGARDSPGLTDGMSGMRHTPSTREAIRRGHGGDQPFDTIGIRWHEHLPAGDGDGDASVPFVAVGARHLHIPTNKNLTCPLLPASGMFATAPAAAGKPRRNIAAATALWKLNSRLRSYRTVQLSTRYTPLIALMITTTVQLGRPDQKTSRRGARAAAAVVAAALLMLILVVTELPNGAEAARPLHGGGGGGGGHDQAAAPGVVMPRSLASSGRSACTNDPNTMEAVPCVHH